MKSSGVEWSGVEWSGVEWVNVAEDRDKWCAVLTGLINLRVTLY